MRVIMKKLWCITAISSLLILSGCATFTDVDFDNKAQQSFKALSDDKPFVAAENTLLLQQLLEADELNKLIDDALQHNPNLQQSLITLKTAEQQWLQSSANQWPELTANLSQNKSEGSNKSFTAGLNVSWTLDVWQQLANTTSAQQANFAAQGLAYQAAKDLLVANVMRSYLDLVQLAQLIAIETKRVSAYQVNEDVIIDRYKKGLIDLKDLDTAKSSTQSAQATLVDYQRQYQQALRNISLLTGLTENSIKFRESFPPVSLPENALADQNLARRPDLQQAYQNILAAQYQHKVAYKALLPNLSISASLSNTDANLHDALFGSHAWQFLGQLTAPLFNAGKLRSDVEVAKLNAEKSYWAFQEQLLSAVNEVSNAVAYERALTKQIQLTKSALESAKRSESTYTNRYRQGTVSLIDLLQVQQNTFSLQAQVTQLTYLQLSNRIDLGLSLGLGV